MLSRILFIVLVILCFLAALMSPDMGFSYQLRTKHETVMPNSSWPRMWRTLLRIGMCEQPKRGVSWHDVRTDWDRFHAIAWHQNYNAGFPGGMGMTITNWLDFRPPSAKHIPTANLATPKQQLWAAARLYAWAEREYPGAGFTAWDCSRIIGFRGFNKDGSWK